MVAVYWTSQMSLGSMGPEMHTSQLAFQTQKYVWDDIYLQAISFKLFKNLISKIKKIVIFSYLLF